MTRGSPISDDLRGVILTMATTHNIPSIVRLMGVCNRTVQRVIQDFKQRHLIARPRRIGRETRGAKRALGYHGSQFLQGYVRFRPDVYLDEMRELVEDRLDVEVSDSTIWRTLSRSGFTMKKVCLS
ncbi:hypothetical protein OF83DRAFT_1024500, partial [Amylostereum chailletii]